MNLCKDCKHHKQVTINNCFCILIQNNCYKDSMISVDLVTGIHTNNSKFTNCYDQRAEISHIENKCGVDGKYWEAK